MCEQSCRVFVSAVGLPPRDAVMRIHGGGMLYMNMVGHPKHVTKCIANDVDIVCAQGGEGGGHTGDIPLSVLIPTIAGVIKGHKSKFTGRDVQLVAAGGMFNGNSLAGALMMGASAIWVGTRFLLCDEASATEFHKEAVRTATFEDNVRTPIFSVGPCYVFPPPSRASPACFSLLVSSEAVPTCYHNPIDLLIQGRPMRVKATPYVLDWEENRRKEYLNLISRGLRPVDYDLDHATGERLEQAQENMFPIMMGKVSAVVNEQKSAKAIVDEMVDGAFDQLQLGAKMIARL